MYKIFLDVAKYMIVSVIFCVKPKMGYLSNSIYLQLLIYVQCII